MGSTRFPTISRATIGPDRRRTVPPIRFGGRSSWRRTDSHVPQRLSRQLRVVTPRLDSIHRSLEFALEMRPSSSDSTARAARARHSGRHQHRQRRQRSGGPIRSRLRHVGCRGNLAFQMHSGAPQPGIYVTSQVYEAMRDSAPVHAGRNDLGRRYRAGNLPIVGARHEHLPFLVVLLGHRCRDRTSAGADPAHRAAPRHRPQAQPPGPAR